MATSSPLPTIEVTLGEVPGKDSPSRWRTIGQSVAGIILAMASGLFLTLGAVINKYVEGLSVGEISLYRYIGVLLFSVTLLMECKDPWAGVPTWNWRFWMLIRALAGCTNLFFHYSAVKFISLADTAAICLITPVAAFIVGRIFLKEPLGRWHVLALLVSSIGVALASKVHLYLLKGDLFADTVVLSNGTLANSLPYTRNPTTRRLIGIAYCVGSVAASAVVYVSLRKIRQTHHAVIIFHFSIVALLETTAINWAFFQFRLPTDGYTPYLMSIIGVCAFFGQLFLTKALQLEEAGIVSVVRSSSEALFAFAFQVALFKESLDVYSIVGALLVISCISFLSFRKYVLGLPEKASLRGRFRFLS